MVLRAVFMLCRLTVFNLGIECDVIELNESIVNDHGAVYGMGAPLLQVLAYLLMVVIRR